MKKFLKWIIGIVTSIAVTVLSSLIVDRIKNISFLSTIKGTLKVISKGIVSFLNFDLKVWWVLIAICILVFVLWLFVKYSEAKEKEEKMSFLSYTQDCFKGQYWEWIWQKDLDGKYGIEYLHPICNSC